jgi:hypothetical protein
MSSPINQGMIILANSLQLVMCTTLTYIPTTILSKLTLCFFYYRLSPSLWYQYSVVFTGFICTTSLVGIWFSVLFACKPIAAGWDVRLSVGAECINRPPIYITQAAFGCVTDLMLLLLPIPTDKSSECLVYLLLAQSLLSHRSFD